MAEKIEVVVKTELEKLKNFRDEAHNKGAFSGPGGKDALTRIDGFLDVVKKLSAAGEIQEDDWKKISSSLKEVYKDLSHFSAKVSQLSPALEKIYTQLHKKEKELDKWSDKKVTALEKRTEAGKKIKSITEDEGLSFHRLTKKGNVTKNALVDPETILKNYKAGTLAMKDASGKDIKDKATLDKYLSDLNNQYETQTKVIDEANTNIQTLSHSIEQLNNQVQAQIEKDRRSGASSDSNLISSVEQSSHAFNKIVNQYNEETAKTKEQQETKIDPDTLKIPQQQAQGWGKAFKAISVYNVAVRALRTSLNAAKNTVIELDRYLTEQAMVTGKTRQETYALLNSYQELALQCGATTKEIAEVSTEYLKQGKSIADALTLTEAAVKAAKVARVSVGDSVNYLTTALNGFRLSAEDAMKVSDKFAAVAAASATDYDELAIALSKVASQANLAGMSIDYTTALLTKGLETTREAPETMGTALKTIIARMRELSDYGETLDDGLDINNVESQLKYVGIALRDSNGELRSTEDVLDELGQKWDNLNKNQQAAIAKALAGTRQQSRLIAMMDDYERVTELQEIAQRSQGATAAQADTYLQGMEAAINSVKVAWEKVTMAFTNSDVIIWFVERAADGLKIIGDLLKSTAGQVGVFGTIASIGDVIVGNKIKEHVWAKEQLKLEREEKLIETEKAIAQQQAIKDKIIAATEEKVNAVQERNAEKIKQLEVQKTGLIKLKNAQETRKANAEQAIADAERKKAQLEILKAEQEETAEMWEQLALTYEQAGDESTATEYRNIATEARNNASGLDAEISAQDTVIAQKESVVQKADKAIANKDAEIGEIDKEIEQTKKDTQTEVNNLIREETELHKEQYNEASKNLDLLNKQKELLQSQLSPIANIASGIKGWGMGIKSFVKDLAKGITNIGKFFTKFKKSKKDLDVTKTTKKNTKAIKDATKTIKAESQAKQQNVEVTKTENTANIQEAQSETVAAKSSQQSAAADTKEATATGQATTADTVETAGNVGEATTEIVAAKSSDTSARSDKKEVIASNQAQKADMKESITNIFESLTEGAANAAQNIPVAGVFIALGLLAAAGVALAVSMANVNGAFDNDYGAQKKAENINKLSGEIYELTERARALDSVVDSFEKIDNKVIKTKADIEEMNSLLEQAGDELSDEIGDDEDIGYGKGISAQEAYKALTREEDKIAFLEAEADRNRKLANDKRQEQLKIFNNARSYEKSQLLYGSDAQYVNARSAIYGINNNTLYESIDALKELEGADEEALAATEELVQGLLEQLDITDALAIANEDADSTIKELINELQDLEATEQFLNEDENFIDRVKAFRELTAALSDNQDMLDALKEAYSEWDTFAQMDDHVLQLIDDLGLSIDEINELYAGYEKLQKADLSITKKDYQERITAVMTDLDADLSNIETVLKSNFSDVLSMAEDAEEAWNTLLSVIGDQIAVSILDMGQAMESFGNKINSFYEKAAEWDTLSESEKMEFISDNSELFSGEGGAAMLEAFQSGDYAAIESALSAQMAERQEQQLAEVRRTLAIEEARVGEDRNEAYIKSLKEYEAYLMDGNNLYKASLDLRLEQEQAQLDKYKEYLESQQEALTESLEKRKEAYEKYFEDINQNKEDEDYEKEAERLISNISKLSSSTNADAMNKTAELTQQLEKLEEERLQELRERAQQAVIDNIDTTIEEINEKFDKLLESNQALLLAMQGELDNPLEFMTDMIMTKADDGLTALEMQQYIQDLQGTYGSVIGNDVFENMTVREDGDHLILNISGQEVVLGSNDQQSVYLAIMEALRAVGLK